MKKLKIGVTGMTCAACSSAIERILNRTEGVDSAVVSLATNDADDALSKCELFMCCTPAYDQL